MSRQYGSGSIFQRADGRWIGRIEAGWTPTGGRRRVVVSSTVSKADCAAKLRAKQREISQHGASATRTQTTTVKAWADVWLGQQVRGVRPKTYAADASMVRTWIVPTIGTKRLTALRPGDVRAVTDAARAAGKAAGTVTRIRAVLLNMLRAARAEGHAVPENVTTVKKTRSSSGERRTRSAIPTDDALRLLDVASSDPQTGIRRAISLMQGMRPGEVLGLTWEMINLDAGVMDVCWQLQSLPYLDKNDRSKGFRVPDEHEARHLTHAYHLVRPKTASGERVIPLVEWGAAALVAHRDVAIDNPWGLVFATTSGRSGEPMPVRDSEDRAAWRDLQDRAGVRHPTGRHYDLYECRHTTATLLLEAGVDPKIVIEIMGHTSIDMSRVYQHASIAQRRRALGQVAALLGR